MLLYNVAMLRTDVEAIVAMPSTAIAVIVAILSKDVEAIEAMLSTAIAVIVAMLRTDVAVQCGNAQNAQTQIIYCRRLLCVHFETFNRFGREA